MKKFMAGMATMYALLTSVMMWTYVAVHPNDNLIKAAFEWPYRVVVVGVTVRGQ